jgi:hypothetical protein
LFGKTSLGDVVKECLWVTTIAGLPNFAGVLLKVHVGKDGVHYEFADVKPEGSTVGADGAFFIPKEHVAYMQKATRAAV